MRRTDDDDNFYPDYYFPYFEGSGISTYADIAIERKIEKEQYVGMCEDSKIGISLIFTLQNGIEYRENGRRVLQRRHNVSYSVRPGFVRNDTPACSKR